MSQHRESKSVIKYPKANTKVGDPGYWQMLIRKHKRFSMKGNVSPLLVGVPTLEISTVVSPENGSQQFHS